MRSQIGFSSSLAVVMAIAFPMVTVAQVMPDLQCYRVVDRGSGGATLDLEGAYLPSISGCKVKLRARFMCRPARSTVSQSSVALSNFEANSNANLSTCYRVTCPKANLGEETVTDRFGVRSFEIGRSEFVCVSSELGSLYSVTIGVSSPTSLALIELEVAGPGRFLTAIGGSADCTIGTSVPSTAFVNYGAVTPDTLRAIALSLDGDITSTSSFVTCKFAANAENLSVNDFSAAVNEALDATLAPASGVSATVVSIVPF
jgi:hypothetical protein